MSRHSRLNSHNSWLGAILVAVIVGGVSYLVFKDEGVTERETVSSGRQSNVAASPGAMILLRVAGANDTEYFELDVDKRSLTKVRETKARSINPLRVEPGDDGIFRLRDDALWDVALRTEDGQTYEQARVLSMYSNVTAAVEAYNEGPRLLIVERSGSIREVYDLPEAYAFQGVQNGTLWLVTLQPGEGIESPPQGPSTILSVGGDGVLTIVKTVDDAVASVIAGESGSLAYGLETGGFSAETPSSSYEGTGRPLLWLDRHRLLVAANKTLKLVDLSESRQDVLAEVSGVPLSAALE